MSMQSAAHSPVDRVESPSVDPAGGHDSAPDTAPIAWAQPPPHAAVATDELHLWRIRTDAGGAPIEGCLARLGEPQRARAARLHHVAHRDRWIRAQAGLREILARYLGGAPESIAFEHGPAGKPALPSGAPPLAFNLTTTGDLALVAVGAGRGPSAEVGIDCEWIRPRPGLLAIAERMLAPEVVAALAAADEAVRLTEFHRAWTALEADAKADGRGLFRPRPARAPPPEVIHWVPEPGYIAAVARRRLPPREAWSAFDLPT